MHSTFDIDGNDEARSSTWLDVSVCPSKVTHWPQSSRVVKIKCRLHVLVPKRANCPCAYGTVPFAHGYPSAYGAFSLCPYAYCSHFCCAQTENLPVRVWFLTFSYSARMGIIFVAYFHPFSNGHFPFLFGHRQLELLMPVRVWCITCLQARHVEPVFYTWKSVHFVGFFVGVQLSPSDATRPGSKVPIPFA